MDVSIVIPLLNEAESLPELNAWLVSVLEAESLDYEIWYIDDGSSDGSWEVIETLRLQNQRVKGLRFQRNYGKSAALQMGFERVTGRVVFTMDADLQDSPDEIPGMLKRMRDEGLDLLSGWKKKRYDPFPRPCPPNSSMQRPGVYPAYATCMILIVVSKHIGFRWFKASRCMEKCTGTFRSLRSGRVSKKSRNKSCSTVPANTGKPNLAWNDL